MNTCNFTLKVQRNGTNIYPSQTVPAIEALGKFVLPSFRKHRPRRANKTQKHSKQEKQQDAYEHERPSNRQQTACETNTTNTTNQTNTTSTTNTDTEQTTTILQFPALFEFDMPDSVDRHASDLLNNQYVLILSADRNTPEVNCVYLGDLSVIPLIFWNVNIAQASTLYRALLKMWWLKLVYIDEVQMHKSLQEMLVKNIDHHPLLRNVMHYIDRHLHSVDITGTQTTLALSEFRQECLVRKPKMYDFNFLEKEFECVYATVKTPAALHLVCMTQEELQYLSKRLEEKKKQKSTFVGTQEI